MVAPHDKWSLNVIDPVHQINLPLIPVFEESPKAKGHQFEQSLNNEDDGKDIVTVFQPLLQVLQETETPIEEFRCKTKVHVQKSLKAQRLTEGCL